jgi:hypothetical protein
MSSSEHIDLLVNAFKVAWSQYFQADRNRGVLECLARPALAEFLVGKVKEGTSDLPSLAAAGLEFLFSMEDPVEMAEDPIVPTWNMHLENASARFLSVGYIRWISG